MHGRRPRSRRGIAWRPASHGDHLWTDGCARCVALDGPWTLAAVRMALPLRSRLQRDAGPRAAGVRRDPRARGARGRRFRLAVRSPAEPVGGGRGGGIRRRDRLRGAAWNRRTGGARVARKQLGPRGVYLAEEQSSRRGARAGHHRDELLSNGHNDVPAQRAGASTSRLSTATAGWSTQLQELLGSRGASPLREPGRLPEVVRGLRRVGVRYVLLHEATFRGSATAAADCCRDAGRHRPDRRSSRVAGHLGVAFERHRSASAGAGGPDLPRSEDIRPARVASRTAPAACVRRRSRHTVDDRRASGRHRVARDPLAAPVRCAPRLRSLAPGRSSSTILNNSASTRSTRRASLSRCSTIASLIGIWSQWHSTTCIRQSPWTCLETKRVTLRIQQTGRGANWWSIYELKIWEQKEER